MTNTAEIEKKAESIEGVVFADPEQQYYVYPAEIRGAKLRAVKVGGSERGMSDKRMAEEIAKTAGVLASDVLDIIKIIPFELIEANNRGLSTCTLEESYVLDLYNTEGNWLLVAFPEIGNIAISFSLSKCRQKNDNTSKKGGEDKVYNEIESRLNKLEKKAKNMDEKDTVTIKLLNVKELRISEPKHVKGLMAEQINKLRQDTLLDSIQRARAIADLAKVSLLAMKQEKEESQ